MTANPLANREGLLAEVFRHETQYWSCQSRVERRVGWVAFSNPALIPRIDPNHAGEFRASAAPSTAVVEDVIAYYQRLRAVPAAYVDLFAPDDLVHELQRAGFRPWSGADGDLMVYEGPDVARPSSVPVEVVVTEAAKEDWASIVDDEDQADAANRQVLRELHLTQISDPRMTAYLTRVDGRAAGRAELFSSDGLGRVEAVRTHRAFQRRGLAAAAIRKAVLDSHQRNSVTYLYAEPGGEAQRLYQQLGFRTVVQNAMRSFLWQGNPE